MKVSLTRKHPSGLKTDCIEYDNIVAYDTFGADDEGPVFHFVFEDGSRASFHKSEWDAFVLEWHELE